MVKRLFVVLLLVGSLFGADDALDAKIKSFVSPQSYAENRSFIALIFEPRSAFYKGDRVDAIKVVEKLKENGLLKLFFKKPQEFQLNFKTSGAPLFFVKIMSDTLQNIGYYRYVTTAATLDASEFTWSINLTSEYVTDPLALQNQLRKSSAEIIDIKRNSEHEWTYIVDISTAKLQVPEVLNGEDLALKRSLYAHWINVAKIRRLVIKSSRRNRWYPYIAYYDSSLHLLKIIKRDRIYRNILLNIPKNAVYMKISDLYTLKNVRDQLLLIPQGER